MKRREFIVHTVRGVGVAWLASSRLTAWAASAPALPQRFSASDTVTLGKTGIKTSRLAMGTGTIGGGHRSNQTALGV